MRLMYKCIYVCDIQAIQSTPCCSAARNCIQKSTTTCYHGINGERRSKKFSSLTPSRWGGSCSLFITVILLLFYCYWYIEYLLSNFWYLSYVQRVTNSIAWYAWYYYLNLMWSVSRTWLLCDCSRILEVNWLLNYSVANTFSLWSTIVEHYSAWLMFMPLETCLRSAFN